MMMVLRILSVVLLAVAATAAALVAMIKGKKHVGLKGGFRIIREFIKNRKWKGSFWGFVSAELSIVGITPALVNISLRGKDFEASVWLTFCQNPWWVSAVAAIVIAFVYYLIVRGTTKASPKELREILNAALLINEEFNFVPTQEWFEGQNTKAIKLLGKRFSSQCNFPFNDMGYALSSLSDKAADRKRLLQKGLDDFDEALISLAKILGGKDSSEKFVNTLKNLSSKIRCFDGSVGACESLASSVNDCIWDYPLWNYCSKQKLEYHHQEACDKGHALYTALTNKWIALSNKRTIIITGNAGVGKSHLIGDIVSRRMESHEPSVLLLGQEFTQSPDVLSQIRSLLGISCREEKLLGELNEYGKKQGTPVVIFIDGINEGAGEDFWKNFFDDLKIAVEGYDYLRLVVSFRTSSRRNYFHDLTTDPHNAVYQHKGFEGHEREAGEYMFSSFNLDQPLWPLYGEELANPLFLTIYCRSHELSGEPLEMTDFWTTIREYCTALNHKLSTDYHYNDVQNLVTDALKAVAKLMVENKNRWQMEHSTVIDRLTEVAKHTKNPTGFLDALLDEGLLREETFDGKAIVDFGFERIGDYFIAEHLIRNTAPADWFDYGFVDLSEAVSVLVPHIYGKELMEEAGEEHQKQALEWFIDSAAWRDTFYAKGHDVIVELWDDHKYSEFFEIVLSRPYRNDDAANGFTLHKLLWDLPMARRDEIWTTAISEEGGIGERVMELAKWGCTASESSMTALNENSAAACAETLVWALSSTWRKLRDTATHALVNIISRHTDMIKPLLEKYHAVNDPYIQERVWCAVYGALLLAQNDEATREVALWTYKNVFVSRNVPEHVLVRGYARDIVLYGESQGLVKDIDHGLINAPFTNGVLPQIPSSDEIASKYDPDFNSVPETDRKECFARDYILPSMATNPNSRTQSYGDFGRYVFQADIEDFGEDIEAMSNWGIQMIFEEFGYDVKAFAKFDTEKYRTGRQPHVVDRIGKKYQWLALYRIMALLMDRHPDLDGDGEWYGPLKRARTLDPTICPVRKANGVSKYGTPHYDVSSPKEDTEWMRRWKEMPRMSEYVVSKDADGVEWVNLFSYNDIIGTPKRAGGYRRSLWTFTQAFVVDKGNLNEVRRNLYKYGTDGRSFHENRGIYHVFSHEFHWSPEYGDAVRSGCYSNVTFSVMHKEFPHIVVDPAYLIYNLESQDDCSAEVGTEILLPNEWLADGLGLRHSRDAGVWVDRNNEVALLDNAMRSGGHRTLLVRKDLLLDYLNRTGKRMFWPVLNERMIQDYGPGPYSNLERSGGVAYMDGKGNIHQRLRCYASPHNPPCKALRQRLSKGINKAILWLDKHHLVPLSEKRRDRMLYGEDFLEMLEHGGSHPSGADGSEWQK